jgi:hypothetical protein
MHQYQVGQLYNPAMSHWPEQVEYNFRAGHHELLLFLPGVLPIEIANVRHGRARFALLAREGILFFLSRFGILPWNEAAYSWHMVPEAERALPDPLTAEEPILLPIVLVDGTTGIIRAMRAVTLSSAFSAALHRAILRQSELAFDQDHYDQALAQIHRRCTVQDLVDRATDHCEV